MAQAARDAIYDVISKRRDIRMFLSEAHVSDEVLTRILSAAHQAPSVGYSQPWDFVLVRDRAKRGRIRENFLRCRESEAARYSPERRAQYLAYRLEGIVESSLNICVTVDLRPAEELVLGTSAQPEALRWSACCAVQNLWLAARAEGVGVGWVSIVEPAVLRSELALPPGIEPVAYLCVGYPVEFPERPMLEQTGWRERRPLEAAMHAERFGGEGGHGGPATGNIGPAGKAAAPDQSSTTIDPIIVAEGTIAALAGDVPPFDEATAEAVRARQLRLTKPAASLGRLEELSAWYAGAHGRIDAPPPRQPEIFVFVADHGVAAEGVSAFSSAVTAMMVTNFLAGGAAINALAGAADASLSVIDVGVAGDLTGLPAVHQRVRFVSAKLRAGTGNLRREPAMTRTEAESAVALGVRLAREAANRGVDLMAVGEMGIANSTAAAAILCTLTGAAPADVVGRGTGLDARGMTHKATVIAEALAHHRPDRDDPIGVLAAVGGLEIAAMAGLIIGASIARRPVVVDGFIATVAALLASALAPRSRSYVCFSHLSAERGHRLACTTMNARPLLDLGLCLGEGTGAALAIPIIRAAVCAQREMSTFATAGIPSPPP
ncbi:MAG: nicotinate-nucleotide--dimethylbenzimidazole phosphoribosyltransferase [Myxococcales bacterium]|nr:nicotinate-nucleotide--dimethylbenzimidazole phosphoribosyltransferase [Myxococcales bacterium]